MSNALDGRFLSGHLQDGRVRNTLWRPILAPPIDHEPLEFHAMHPSCHVFYLPSVVFASITCLKIMER
nr:hypothetical protein [Tanacetum cinerariifolium]